MCDGASQSSKVCSIKFQGSDLDEFQWKRYEQIISYLFVDNFLNILILEKQNYMS